MRRRTPRSTRTDTILPDTKLFRSRDANPGHAGHGGAARLPYRGSMASDLQPLQLVGGVEQPVLAVTVVQFVELGREERARRQIVDRRSEEHTSELQSLMRISYAVF